MTPSEKANRLFWAKRRDEQRKAAVTLSVAEFVVEGNRRLGVNNACVSGTRFVLSGQGETSFPTWEGPPSMRSLVHRIVQEMAERFEISVAFRIDR